MAPLLLFIALGLMGYLLWRHYKELGVLDHIPGHSSWTRYAFRVTTQDLTSNCVCNII